VTGHTRVSRRKLLISAAMSSTSVLLASRNLTASGQSDGTATPIDGATVPAEFNEAPMLQELVEAGDLPPVGDRLPPSPEVVPPVESIGNHGGTATVAIGNPNALFGDPQSIMGTELILRIDDDYSTITAGLCESWEFHNNAQEQILHLRQGLKWSDGQPFTTADFLFSWEDVALNSELSPAGPGNDWVYDLGDERVPMTMEAIDEYTLRLTFPQPDPLIILRQAFYPGAQGGGGHLSGLWQPKHYGEQFHPNYTDQATLDEMVEEAGFENWTQLYTNRTRMSSTLPAQVGLPAMTAFVRVDDSPQRHTYERNPYYWKVDPEGNQLPYIDQVQILILTDPEIVTARLLAGELDFLGQQTQFANLSVYQSAVDSGQVKLYLWDSTLPGKTIFYPNLTSKDEELRSFFQNQDVRHALSLALDRTEINDVVHFGLAEPRQWAMWPQSIYYREGDEQHWADFDPDQAESILEDAGYPKGADGFRTFPSGNRVGWTAQFDQAQFDALNTFQLVRDYWQQVGLEVNLSPVNRTLLEELILNNEIQMTSWEGDVSDITWSFHPRAMLPGITNGKWGRAWELWLLGEVDNELAEEPPDEVKQQWERWVQLQVTVDEAERMTIAREMFDWYYEYLPVFSDVGVAQAIVVRERLKNVPENGTWGFAVIRAVPIHPEQFYLQD